MTKKFCGVAFFVNLDTQLVDGQKLQKLNLNYSTHLQLVEALILE